jgi:hypothetical protein
MKPHFYHRDSRWYVSVDGREYGGAWPRHAWNWYLTASARPLPSWAGVVDAFFGPHAARMLLLLATRRRPSAHAPSRSPARPRPTASSSRGT